MQITNADRNLSLFSKGIKASGLEEKLNEYGPFTILGPVNLALNRLMALSYEQLLLPSNLNKLVDFLSGYIITGKKMMSDFRNNQKLTTLSGKTILIELKNEEVNINGARIRWNDGSTMSKSGFG